MTLFDYLPIVTETHLPSLIIALILPVLLLMQNQTRADIDFLLIFILLLFQY